MPLFAARQQRGTGKPDGTAVPDGFEALADALRTDGDPLAAVHEIGRNAAAEGASLDEVLRSAEQTCLSVTGQVPSFPVTRELAVAWSEASLRFYHALSCEDPLTGLATLSHLRSRLNEIYRAAERDGLDVGAEHALVVVEIGSVAARFDRLMRMVDVAHKMRSVYAGDETIGQLSHNRLAAVVRRSDGVGDRVTTLRDLLAEWGRGSGATVRVWIEGLPPSSHTAETLVDELAR